MINLFLVVIATQFSVTKERENERMVAEKCFGMSKESKNL